MAETSEPIPVSAIQHWCYCPRQCLLIHAEQAFAENVHTMRGQAVHERVDQAGVETRAGVRTARAVPLWSDRLGLVGKADVVEFLADGTPYPVEYKHGRKGRAAKGVHDHLQLAAQALCLEEMTGKGVAVGAIYHATSHRRREVTIGSVLRTQVAETVVAIRQALAAGTLPPPVNDERCRECSLIDLCQPAPLAAQARQKELACRLFVADD
ncbi:MAG: CRISPR-associated protein Cas4 [Candidatus Accumulibacter sp.]|uniref:CRISPR-associated protein Cas4 n=1 Tax=Accumulibacter sp. TaxID=2053492 RepID=UPI0019EA40B2|nr:CRISPR-associated protein Cas4 [Accumulibacter sp.]MBE2258932.1 CRISPR-associated protein Cas4 [Paracoccaceae bacterium]MCP5249060.1 CRISPR-associated protein Cas4 [Accumulibacter sp.]